MSLSRGNGLNELNELKAFIDSAGRGVGVLLSRKVVLRVQGERWIGSPMAATPIQGPGLGAGSWRTLTHHRTST